MTLLDIILASGWLLMTALFVVEFRAYRKARYLATKGYFAQCVSDNWYWHPPKHKKGRGEYSGGYALSDAVRREKLIDERIRLDIPQEPEHKYELGGFAE
jgi:hypothetical protein